MAATVFFGGVSMRETISKPPFYLVMGGNGKFRGGPGGAWREHQIKVFDVQVGEQFAPASIARIPNAGRQGEFVAPPHKYDFGGRGMSSGNLWSVQAHDRSGVMVNHDGRNFAVKMNGKTVLKPGQKGFRMARPGDVISDEFGDLHAIVAQDVDDVKRFRDPRAFSDYLVKKGAIKMWHD